MRTTFKIGLLGSALLGCQPSAVQEPVFEAAMPCCGGAGSCVASGMAPNELEAQFDGASCSGGLLCAPRDWLLDPYTTPSACRAPGDREGRCLSTCLTSVAEQIDRLDQRGCDRDQRCAPCFDPVTGEDTGACRLNGDAPAEAARTYQACCGAAGEEQGLCVPLSLLSAEEIDLLPVESCAEPGTRCAPSALFSAARERLVSAASDTLAMSADAALARCFVDDAPGESCAACTRQLHVKPACE